MSGCPKKDINDTKPATKTGTPAINLTSACIKSMIMVVIHCEMDTPTLIAASFYKRPGFEERR